MPPTLTEERLNLFQEMSEYIDSSDYSSYTLQYPPPFLSKNIENTDEVLFSYSQIQDSIWLYVHIPFCSTKCTFCRYFSFVSLDEQLYSKYIDYLILELKMYKKYLPKKTKLSSVYIGGGTPNIVSAQDLEKLLSYIFENFSKTDDFQFCIEFNPHQSDTQKLDVIKKYGCHRLTIGVQSMDEKVLEAINRDQTKEDVVRTIKYAKKIGIPYVNIDMMMGITGQSLHSFIHDLQLLVGLEPDMIHMHPFFPTKRTIDNSIPLLTQKLRTTMQAMGNKLLQSAGYSWSDKDGMGKTAFSDNKQLSDATSLGKYLWIWISAVGFNGAYRSINVPTIPKYFSLIESGKLPVEFSTCLTPKDNMIQFMVYQMRYGKISILKFQELFWKDPSFVFAEAFKELSRLWKVSFTSDEILCNFQTIQEYLVYSKIFYSDEIIEYYVQHKG